MLNFNTNSKKLGLLNSDLTSFQSGIIFLLVVKTITDVMASLIKDDGF